MEFWRCVNLYHLCTYVLADKQRSTYNLDNFLVPVASAFGEWDRKSKFGMLRLEELELLHDTEAQNMLTLARAADDAHAKNGGGDESFLESFKRRAQSASTNRIDGQMALKRDKYHKKAKQAPTGAMDAMSERSERFTRRSSTGLRRRSEGARRVRGTLSKTLARSYAARRVEPRRCDARGARSPSLHARRSRSRGENEPRRMARVRNAVCMKLRSNSERLKQRALFRLPRIYQASVRFLVASTILTDSYLLASPPHACARVGRAPTYFNSVGRPFTQLAPHLVPRLRLPQRNWRYADAVWRRDARHADLSYVCGSAEVSLRMMVGVEQSRPNATSKSPANELFGLLNQPLDRQRLVRHPGCGADPCEEGGGGGGGGGGRWR